MFIDGSSRIEFNFNFYSKLIVKGLNYLLYKDGKFLVFCAKLSKNLFITTSKLVVVLKILRKKMRILRTLCNTSLTNGLL